MPTLETTKKCRRLRMLGRHALLGAALLGLPQSAQAKPPVPAPAASKEKEKEEAPGTARARELFARGATHVRAAQWAEALAAFEESSQLRPHPVTTYNIAACERALGRYTVAQATFQQALSQETGNAKLPEALRAEAKTYLAEIETLLVRVNLTVTPIDAAVAVDGRPLQAVESVYGRHVLVAGRRPGGKGEILPDASVEVLLDPGTHLITLSRKGYSDRVVNKTFSPGAHAAVKLNLDSLPATLRVSSNEAGSRVRVQDLDVGYAPVEIQRPGGPYQIIVEKPGFASYHARINVNPGEQADINALLSPTPITQKWWFWTAIGVVATGAVVGTYFATRSDPVGERPPLDGGGLGWTVKVP